MRQRVDLDWANLGFSYLRTPWRFQAEHRDGAWRDGDLLAEATITLEEGACALHYAQQCFEGLKAFTTPDDRAVLFRPEENARRMAVSARRLLMPPPPEELFLHGVRECVRSNDAYMPPHGLGASMYVRPLLIGVGDNLGLRPAPRYLFRVFCSPVGPYFKGGWKAIRLRVTRHDRVAPNGTGAFKVGGNYAGGLLASTEAKAAGYDEALYLDPIEHRWLEEAGSANVFGVLPPRARGGKARLVTPASASILPSVTMDSVLTLAAEDLGLEVERRRVAIDEVADFVEMGCTGTAAVITPVSVVHDGERDVQVGDGAAPGPITQELYARLTGIQRGKLPDPRGWVVSV
ncbi:MAG: branched-chain amino acid aminotransferase [Planctomycetes bacterium]|nr:branched-chain amino acid aminotransferase [Planctomycetota bacterium]